MPQKSQVRTRPTLQTRSPLFNPSSARLLLAPISITRTPVSHGRADVHPVLADRHADHLVVRAAGRLERYAPQLCARRRSTPDARPTAARAASEPALNWVAGAAVSSGLAWARGGRGGRRPAGEQRWLRLGRAGSAARQDERCTLDDRARAGRPCRGACARRATHDCSGQLAAGRGVVACAAVVRVAVLATPALCARRPPPHARLASRARARSRPNRRRRRRRRSRARSPDQEDGDGQPVAELQVRRADQGPQGRHPRLAHGPLRRPRAL